MLEYFGAKLRILSLVWRNFIKLAIKIIYMATTKKGKKKTAPKKGSKPKKSNKKNKSGNIFAKILLFVIIVAAIAYIVSLFSDNIKARFSQVKDNEELVVKNTDDNEEKDASATTTPVKKQDNPKQEEEVKKPEVKKEETKKKQTGTKTRWRPDLDVFTDINVSEEYFHDILKRQAVVNPNILFLFRFQNEAGGFNETEFIYENGITDYVTEIAGEEALTSVQHWTAEKKGKDREDKPEYKVKLDVALTFSNKAKLTEYYHNSSFLEHGGSPEDAVKRAFTAQIDSYIKSVNGYQKNESKIKYEDVDECLILVSSSFSTVTSYENQTKKAITNKFIREAMTEFLRHQLEVYFIENPDEAKRISEQILLNKRSRENAEKTRLNMKKKLTGTIDLANSVEKFVDCRTKDITRREIYIVEGDSALGSVKLARDSEFQAVIPIRGKILNCLKAEYTKIFKSDIITDLIKVLGCGVEVKSGSKELSGFVSQFSGFLQGNGRVFSEAE